MRVLFCWTQFSGYMAACWRALQESSGIELVVLGRSGSSQERTEAPYSTDIMSGITHRALSGTEMGDWRLVASMVANERPDVVVVAGWGIPAYRNLPGAVGISARFAMTMDTPFQRTWKQKLAPFVVGRFVRRMDAVVVPGERAWQYARYLGVAGNRIHRGLYAYDDGPLRGVYTARNGPGGWPARFLFMARYHPHKAVDTLMEGYRRYRTQVTDPWPLDCYGSGPLRDLIKGQGVTDLGFVQPSEQPRVWGTHGAFVLSSRHEPWGVAIAEAAASGLPVVCSEACGASIELVRNLYNGITFPTDDVEALAGALQWVHVNHANCPAMGARSRDLALPFSAAFWAKRWKRLFEQLTQKPSVR